MIARMIPFTLIVFGSIGSSGNAQGTKSSETVSWWNPLSWTAGEDSSVRKSTYFDNSAKKSSSDSAFSIPQIPWLTTEDKPASKARKKTSPSVFSRMGQSTKRAWDNTIDFLNPFDNGPPAAPKQQGYQPQQVESKSGGGMFGWMWREEKVESPSTVNEFLRQERPRF
jgi:hypothetical protein